MTKLSKQDTFLNTLIIEDVEDDALLLVDLLESQCYHVNWRRVDNARHLKDALEQPWDIVFSDYSMPGFSGEAALKMLRQQDAITPFVFVSGTIGEEAAAAAIRAGANDYVMKTNLSRFLPTVERELKEAEVRRQQQLSAIELKKLSMAVNQVEESITIIGADGRIQYVNPAFERLTGYTLSELRGAVPSFLCRTSQSEATCNEIWRSLKAGKSWSSTISDRNRYGHVYHEEVVVTPLKGSDGEILHYVSTGRDITARVMVEQERARLAAILEATPDYVVMVDPDHRVLYLNGSWRRFLGMEQKNIEPDTRLAQIFSAQLMKEYEHTILPELKRVGTWSGETVIVDAKMQEQPVSLVVLAHTEPDGRMQYISMMARDISERKKFEAELHHRATHDALTHLPNRFLLKDRLKSAIHSSKRRGTMVAVFFMDMNNFKRVNDSLGHTFGDVLLVQVANRIQASLRPSDTVARLGGDEFVIVADELARPEAAIAILKNISAEFERPVIVGSHKIYPTFSTGIAVCPDDAENVDDLLRYADAAMYRSKLVGNNQYFFYAPGMNSRGYESFAIEAELRFALQKNQLQLHYQPQHSAKTGMLVGYEALLRWNHPVRGQLAPLDFIPLLESTGLILPVGEWVIRQACVQHRSLRALGYGYVRISVNVSALQFADRFLSSKIRTILDEERMPRDRIELEITENIVIQDPIKAAAILFDLQQTGVRTAIDDFGIGYSSLAYLKKFPLNVLKIDQSFVRGLGEQSGDAAIVEASIFLAKKLGLEVVAEGVENRVQLQQLQHFNCDLVQGYYMSRPLAEENMQAYLTKSAYF